MTIELKTISDYELLRMARRSLEDQLSYARDWAAYYAYDRKDPNLEAFYTKRAFELDNQIKEISAAMWDIRKAKIEVKN